LPILINSSIVKKPYLGLRPKLASDFCFSGDLGTAGLGCAALGTMCDLQTDWIFYGLKKPSTKNIVGVDCAKQGETPQNNDCDWTYHWVIEEWAYNYPSFDLYWRWWSTSWPFRLFVELNDNGSISGFRFSDQVAGGTEYYGSSFIGNTYIVWIYMFFEGDCPQDQWISTMRFDVLNPADIPKK